MRQNLVIITSFILCGSILCLFGCDNERNTDAICKNNPEICVDLHKDSWCRFEKGALIRHRYELSTTKEATGEQLYRQLIYLEDYSHCVELAAGVQHIVNPQRTNDRARAFSYATQNLAELQDSTKGNTDVHLSYYHWSRFNDQKALQRLMTAEKQDKLNDPLILSNLASNYLKFDVNTARKLYLKVLATTPASQLNPDWLLGLANAYRQQRNLEQAYMLSKANILMTEREASSAQMLALVGGDRTLASKLDQQAKQLTVELLSERYSDSETRQWLENAPE